MEVLEAGNGMLNNSSTMHGCILACMRMGGILACMDMRSAFRPLCFTYVHYNALHSSVPTGQANDSVSCRLTHILEHPHTADLRTYVVCAHVSCSEQPMYKHL